MATANGAGWQLKGTVVIACNCDYGCPCNFNALPTTGDCEGGWTWHVDEGTRAGVDLAGLNFSMLCDWPKAIHEGNGVAMLLIDEGADDRQRIAIDALLRGGEGGPWGILINTFTTVHGPHFVPYDVTIDDERATVRAGDVLSTQTEPVRNPVTQVEAHPRAILPQGFISKDVALLRSSAFRVKGEISYDHTGQYAAVGKFDYKSA